QLHRVRLEVWITLLREVQPFLAELCWELIRGEGLASVRMILRQSSRDGLYLRGGLHRRRCALARRRSRVLGGPLQDRFCVGARLPGGGLGLSIELVDVVIVDLALERRLLLLAGASPRGGGALVHRHFLRDSLGRL